MASCDIAFGSGGGAVVEPSLANGISMKCQYWC